MFPLAPLMSFPVVTSFDWGSAIPISMAVALLVSGGGVLGAALFARRRPLSAGNALIPDSSEAAAQSQHSTIAA